MMPHAVAVATDVDDVAVMQEKVDQNGHRDVLRPEAYHLHSGGTFSSDVDN